MSGWQRLDDDRETATQSEAPSFIKLPEETRHDVTHDTRAVMEDGSSVIQFSTRTYYCREDEQVMVIDVVRLGDATGTAAVCYGCEDGSAVDGRRYHSVSGEVEFRPDETLVSIEVPVLQSAGWEPALEFTMYLSSAKGALLGRLQTCRVWIIDTSRFPSSRIGKESSRFELLYEFFKHLAQDPFIRSGSLKMLAIDQLPNLLHVLQLALQVRLVDEVLQPLTSAEVSEETVRRSKVLGLAYGLLYALPIFGSNWLKLSKCWLGVGGAARRRLQVDLLRKYVNLTSTARREIGPAGFIAALSRYSIECVDNGYTRLFECAKSIGKILILLIWTIFSSPLTFPIMLLLPVVLVLRMIAQEADGTSLRLKLFRAQDLVVAQADDVARNLPLIRDYQTRPAQAKR